MFHRISRMRGMYFSNEKPGCTRLQHDTTVKQEFHCLLPAQGSYARGFPGMVTCAIIKIWRNV
jgi:hypothetical protein